MRAEQILQNFLAHFGSHPELKRFGEGFEAVKSLCSHLWEVERGRVKPKISRPFHSQVSHHLQRIGYSPKTVANHFYRQANLPPDLKEKILSTEISPRKAEILSRIRNKELRGKLVQKAIREKLTWERLNREVSLFLRFGKFSWQLKTDTVECHKAAYFHHNLKVITSHLEEINFERVNEGWRRIIPVYLRDFFQLCVKKRLLNQKEVRKLC